MKRPYMFSLTACLAIATSAFCGDLYFLGDDYTDSGDYPTTPWTGGTQIWSTYLGSDFNQKILPLKNGGTDFACALALTGSGIAGAISMLEQSELLVNSSTRDSSEPVFVFGGMNDLIYQLVTPYSQNQTVQNLMTIFQSLHSIQYKNIVSMNVFDVGKLPQGIGMHPSHSQLTEQTISLNAELASQIAALPFKVLPIDVYSLLNSIVANPSLYGFNNVTTPAPGPSDFQGYLYWFPIGEAQPLTLQFHQILADYVFSIIEGAEFYATLAEQPQTALRAITANLKQQIFPTQDCHALNKLYLFASGNYVPLGRAPMAQEHSFKSYGGDLVVGVTDRITKDWTVGGSIGIALDRSRNHRKNDNSYRFSTCSEILSFLTSYSPRWGYLNGIINGGWFQFPYIRRTFALGPLSQETSAKTGGYGFSAAWQAAYFPVNDPCSFQTGPLAILEYQGVIIKGYAEHDALIGNLVFDSQMSNSLIGGLGWEMRLRKTFSPFTLVTDISFSMNRQWIHGGRTIALRESTLPDFFGGWAIPGKRAWFGTGNITFSSTFHNGSVATVGYLLNYGEKHMSESFLTLGLTMPFKPN